MAEYTVPKRYRELVHLLARAFYSGQCPPPEPDQQPGGRKKEPYVGLGVIVLDALTRREWVAEDEFANDLKVGVKVMHRVLRYFEQELLVAREHRKVKASRAKEAAQESFIPAALQAGIEEEEEEAPLRGSTVSYCKLDYPTLLEACQLRLHLLRTRLRKHTQDRSAVLSFKCPTGWCAKEASMLDAAALVQADGTFRCDVCGAVLEPMSTAAGEDAVSEEQRQQLQALQEHVEKALEPLTKHLKVLTDEVRAGRSVPESRPLSEWLADRAKRKQDAEGGPAAELAAPPEFEAATAQAAAGVDAAAAAAPKELPPWLQSSLAGQATAPGAANEPTGLSIADAQATSTAPAALQSGGWQVVAEEPASKRLKAEAAGSIPAADEDDDEEWL